MIRPRKSAWMQRAFRVYNRGYLRRSFHRVHLDGDLDALRGDGRTPLLICLNHSSWWDLLLGLYLDELLPAWDCYAPMDEAQLRRYAFFARLGVIGVDRSSLQGAREFVDYAYELLEGRPRALLITAHGEFVSSSVRPVRFQSGIGSIGARLSDFLATTVVFDYEFWAEKQPEAFISIRSPERITATPEFDRRAFVATMEKRMEAHLDSVRQLREQRSPALFKALLRGGSGVSPIYDATRTIAARLSGERLTRMHGAIRTPTWRERER